MRKFLKKLYAFVSWDNQIASQTRFTRAVTLRLDRYGVYFVFWDGINMTGSLSYQWPRFFQPNNAFGQTHLLTNSLVCSNFEGVMNEEEWRKFSGY